MKTLQTSCLKPHQPKRAVCPREVHDQTIMKANVYLTHSEVVLLSVVNKFDCESHFKQKTK